MKLRNGTVLPHGIVGSSSAKGADAFNKTYKNNSIKAGIIVKRYEVEDKDNLHKLAVEYDVMVMEQNGNSASSPILYKHCLSVDGLGSIADFFEKKFRQQKKKGKKSKGLDFPDQDGAIVLLMCLDGASEKGIIIGGLRHPDRKTKLTGKDEILAAEYNGVAITISEDGSCNLTFKGATDHSGAAKDSSQGNTTVDIEKDGSFQIKNKGVTQRNQKDGKFALTTQDSTTMTAKGSFNINTSDAFSLKAKADASFESTGWVFKASGSATLSMESLDLKSNGQASFKASMIDMSASSLINMKGSQIVLDGQVALGGAGGTPAITLLTQSLGIGNLGGPVLSTFIGPYSTRVTII